MHHFNPATGVIIECGDVVKCYIDKTYHFEDRDSAEIARKSMHSNDEMDSSVEFDALLRAASSGGFVKSSVEYPDNIDAQVEILKHSIAISYISDKLAVQNSNYVRSRYANVIAWVVRELAEENRETPQRFYHREVENLLRTNRARATVQAKLIESDPPMNDILSVAADLWVYRHTPFHDRVKYLLFIDDDQVSGYTKKDENVFLTYSNFDVIDAMKIKMDDLPSGVLAFDIETDTEFGYGLRPTKSQITEVVVSSKEQSWVLAGDEKFILESFANLLNNQKSPVVLVGWNNYGFDDIALQTRAEFHQIKNWNGRLTITDNYTRYEPVGPLGEPMSLIWTTPEGVILKDRDIFQEKSFFDKSRGKKFTGGLKPFLESIGCEPIKVDRSRLHELSEKERTDYVLSDGICTLRALTELGRLRLAEYIQEPLF